MTLITAAIYSLKQGRTKVGAIALSPLIKGVPNLSKVCLRHNQDCKKHEVPGKISPRFPSPKLLTRPFPFVMFGWLSAKIDDAYLPYPKMCEKNYQAISQLRNQYKNHQDRKAKNFVQVSRIVTKQE